MRIESLIEHLQHLDWYQGQMAFIKEIPAREPRYAELQPPLPTALQRHLDRRGIRLYTHQARAIELIRAGKHVILTTPTASGKTLAFNLPIFERLSREEKATALYLYPLKALANDQLRALQELETSTNLNFQTSVYDGDTPEHLRPKIRQRARIILSNPYALHQYLPWHSKWKRFFENLRFIVLDEAHGYRGVFGSNVSMLMRRFTRLLEFYGAKPQFVLASATMANPLEHAQKLTRQAFSLVAEDGAAHGRRFFVFWDALRNEARSVHRQTSDLFAQHVNADLQTLCFTVSRKMAELTTLWAQRATRKALAAYRAGYLPKDRRRIEQALKDGTLNGVATTNALELGVDIGGLDSVIISGYPGTVLSTWQQAGRAGRGLSDSLVTLVAFANLLDQFFIRHPERFFERPHEHAILDLGNEYILLGHLMCAAAELPIREGDEKFFGPRLAELLTSLQAEGLIQKTPMGWVYRGLARPAEVVSLDHISAQTVRLLCEGEVLETIERRRALEAAHPGAVFLHQGETFLMESLHLSQGIALARRADVDYHTDALKATEIRVRRVHVNKRWGEFELRLGEVAVQEQVIGYRVVRYDKPLGVQALDLPATEFETVALWFTLPGSLREKISQAGWDWAGGLHAAEHALIAMTPFFAMCDRWDIGGLSTPLHLDTGTATIFIYDGFQGGIGITEKTFQLFSQLVQTTHELVRDCPCEAGCPSCIYSPKCGHGNQLLDKRAARIILAELLVGAHGRAPLPSSGLGPSLRASCSWRPSL
jgi:DEAD/DEAH box helicase domain-containing protein